MVNPLAAAIAPQQGVATAQPQAAPAVAQPQQSPPQSPEELEQRKGAWAGYFEKLKQDPDVRNALMQFGTQMLAGEQRGQSTASLLANSVQNSMGYLQRSRQEAEARKVAATDKGLEQDKLRADTDGVRATTGKVGAETAQVAPKAEATIDLQGAQAGNQDASAAETTATTPGKVSKLSAEAQKIVSEVGVQQQNADSSTLNAETNMYNVQLDNLVDQAKLVQTDRELDLKADQIQKVYEAAMLKGGASSGSPDMQMLSHFINNLHGGDIAAGTKAWYKQKVTLARAGAITTADTGINASTSENIQDSAGFSNPATPQITAAVKAKYGESATTQATGNGTFNVLVNGTVVDTVTAGK